METKISGVYKITNKITGDCYIGSSKDISRRWRQHKKTSTRKYYSGRKLYKAFIEYGLDNFSFEIIEETVLLKEREQYWIDQLCPSYNDRHANGVDIEKRKKYKKKYSKKYVQTEKGKDIHRKSNRKSTKKYNSRLCFYNNEIITLGALSTRFCKQGIPHPTKEAKKYIITN